MDMNEYYMQVHVKEMLAEARQAAERERLLGPTPSRLMPALRAGVEHLRGLYSRWSSAASAGSKPTTARAWSRSR